MSENDAWLEGCQIYDEFLAWEESQGISSELMHDRANKPSRITNAVRCKACTRPLQTEDSIAKGYGPVCRAREGVAS